VIHPEVDVLSKAHSPAVTDETSERSGGRVAAGNAARIKDLGYTVAKHINMYGEHFKVVSDPVEEGDCTIVQVTSGNDPAIRTLRLPVAMLLGASAQSGRKARFGKKLP